MQNLSNLLARRRAVYSVLIGIILLTLPCYIVGGIALAIAPKDRTTQPTPQVTATFLLLATVTSSGPTPTLGELPTQFVPASVTPKPASSETAAATSTPTPTATKGPTPTDKP